MKISCKKTALAFVAFVAMYCFSTKPAAAQPGVSVSIQTFYDELEPYGQWIDDPELGYVWAPDAGPDFKPYATNGHWAATEYGNTWVSDYDWGWAAFHYGRWRFASDYGWEWIPGIEWAPAWVNWRTGEDYYGWAPLGPGVNIDVAFGAGYYEPDNYWVFAPRRSIYEPNIYRYCLPAGRNYSIIRNTTIINNVYNNNNRRYVFGPRPDDVRRYTNAPINIYNINDSRRPGGARIRNNTINIYRPQVAFNNNDGNRPEPNRVINRGSYSRNQGFNNGSNNPNGSFNGRGNGGNTQNYPSNNNGSGRNNGNYGSGNQLPRRTFPSQNQTPSSSNGMQNPGTVTNQNGNYSSGGFGGRNNNPNAQPNQPAQNQNGNYSSGGFGGRNNNPINQPTQ
ncbi:MAG: hypothetical protein EOP41_08745, partial [Sphingobacteriaceae bacterium]